ncbi:hypothetical protein, partial [Plantactinospora sp. KLBMP9567]|uniref:hypothetical protein n=1 Tax=Plantactinospora sp. KLBMP9567 TaxID=3085900 RepID=UPI0029816A60
ALYAALDVAVGSSRGAGKVRTSGWLRRAHVRSQSFSSSEIVTPVAVDRAVHHLNRPGCDETGKKIAPGRCIDVEGNDHW